MEKFVRGPFSTIDEVKEALEHLHREGYSSQSIKVVANKQKDLDALQGVTSVDILKEDVDNLGDGGKRPFWEQLSDTFSGFFFNNNFTGSTESSVGGYVPISEDAPIRDNRSEDEYEQEDDDSRMVLAKFKSDLEDGKIVILVEDVDNREAKFNLDAIDNHKNLKNNSESSTKEIDADPSQVMEETTTERDSHPDIENDEEVLQQETTYVPTDSDSAVDVKTNRDHPAL